MKSLLRSMAWPVVCGVLLALVIMQQFPEWLGLPAHDIVLREVSETRSNMGLVSYASGVERAAPAVVNIYTSKQIASSSPTNFDNPSVRDYADSLPNPERRQSSLGSAVILNSEGYLLTNNHVIAGSDEILVALQDGREALASLIGTDPETDLAVLKIDLPDLPAVTIDSRDQQRIGDVVMAIGNPFGLGQTVTMGIISATGRNQLGLNTYEDFIQTDAAINQGNSGGALVDAQGNLIGINTAIFSQAGSAQGIGFAIPAKLAVEVMQAIIQHGRVIRGWLGVEVQPLTPELAESFGLDISQGIVVASLYRNGPAWNAGLLPGDVILKIDDQAATSGRQAMNQVARAKPSDRIKLSVLRNGEQMSFSAEVGVRPSFRAAN
ncbi:MULTISPECIES: S1C family serine protease [Pseudomonas]|uniref:PDZ domain-containing protein n=1 Tax=Pseudomonas neustonica TaxID=2487346 RepID=A0ABX9XL37_9PSED|nr:MULTISPECIES: trypsin-like peptidase domain-containing protein [Pseudomonas]MBA6420556.1 trypsin-like peptidase domain-containing protein [Pseudomonas sp. 5Ae-yellow]ROZ83594.1 PDZ domain-containing protein [Pseudomonas sp. SSM44]ROZ85452.1 PDZ domain-containing protein [Pseudomonas neustonica]|tara:strand:- start:804 stop:1943 length:1140 start_codon:yes stop_codon:yes gene_type:complete